MKISKIEIKMYQHYYLSDFLQCISWYAQICILNKNIWSYIRQYLNKKVQSTFIFLLIPCTCMHRRTGPVSFRGAEVSCPYIFSIACPKIQWFARILPEFLPEYGYFQNSRGGGGLQPPSPPPPPPPPRLVRLCMYVLGILSLYYPWCLLRCLLRAVLISIDLNLIFCLI